MTLTIDPNTPKGQVQLEAIKWAEEQFNKILVQYFNNKYRIQKGLIVHFQINIDPRVSQDIKVTVDELAPQTLKRFKEAIDEALDVLDFPAEVETKEGEVVDGK